MRGLRRDEQGAALIEFAIGLPVLVLLLTGGMELTNLALTHMRLNRTAELLADNASRIRNQADEFDLGQIFEGAKTQGSPIDLENRGRMIVSSVEDNGLSGANKGQTIRWQRCDGARTAKAPKYGQQGRGKNDSSLRDGVGPPGRKIVAQPGSAVMLAEVVYDYEPMIFTGIIPSGEIRYEAAFNVRERDELGITNVKGKPVKSC